MDCSKVREILPKPQKKSFDDIVYQKVLGASKHITMIGEMFVAIAEDYEKSGKAAKAMIDDIYVVANYFKETRGQASSAIGNAIDIMVGDLDRYTHLPTEEAATKVSKFVSDYSINAKKDIEKIVDYSVNLSQSMKRILVFDYSSTVNRYLEKLGETKKDITVFIPESRTINGGYAFVSTCLQVGFKVHFIPDAAIMYYLKQCDAAFFGAETFYADGTVFNTMGSDIVGLVCKSFNIPLYILTPMIKLDIRPIYGLKKDLVINDLRDKMRPAGFDETQLEEVEFQCPELLPVQGEYVTAFVTEQGIIPSTGLFERSLDYIRELNGGIEHV